MRAFFGSDAGKGTAGVCLTCLILIWPLVGTWLVAGLTLFFAVHHFREAFRRLDAEAEGTPRPLGPPAAGTALAVPARGEALSCDVGAGMAALAANPARPLRSGRQAGVTAVE